MKRGFWRRQGALLRAWTIVAAGCGLGATTGIAFAQPSDVSAQAQWRHERQRIADERRQLEAGFAVEQQRCFQRFAVNDCLNASRARQRKALAVLRRQEIVINDEERRHKAAEQRQRIAEREAERARKAAAAPAAAPPDRAAAAKSPMAKPAAGAADARSARAAKKPLAPRREPDAADAERRRSEAAAKRAERAGEAQANAERSEEKLRDAAEHKARVLKENAERQKSARPLPVPPLAGEPGSR